MNNLSTAVQRDSVVTAAKQRLRFSRKQAFAFHLECVEIVIDVTHSHSGRRYQVNT